MTPVKEQWAEALAVMKQHGDHSFAHAAERIGALVLENDRAGVVRWRQIAACIDKMSGGTHH